jgi:flagellar protein FliJ
MATRRFVFRLQKVLEYREALEQRAQSELAALEAERARAIGERDELAARRDASENRLREIQRGELDPLEDMLLRNFIRDLENRIVRKTEEIRLLDRRVDAKRDELVQAGKDRKVMERLRERAHDEFIREHLRIEQGNLDEIGGQLFNRGRATAKEAGETP